MYSHKEKVLGDKEYFFIDQLILLKTQKSFGRIETFICKIPVAA